MPKTTNTVQLTDLRAAIANSASRYYRLVLLAGPSGAGKTPLLKAMSDEDDVPYLNVNLALSERLLPLTLKQRPLRVHRLLAEILDAQPAPVVCLDNIELLFDPSLHQDPLVCLQGLSRNKTLVVAWGGQFEGTVLSYAEPGHPEYHRYDHPDAAIVVLT
ncbi:MAG: BREX-3 system P-loop-containing protein BrxF [Anaerolineae bacterium]|nr:BREX-3 system P-loop-containing protein BrxF [Anaerolineae bacterium]